MAIEVPPESSDAVRAALRDRNKLVYLVIAASDSDAWAIALAAEQDIVGVFPVRFQERKDAREWITDDSKIAAAADWEGKIHTLFTAAQAENKDFVEEALNRPPANT